MPTIEELQAVMQKQEFLSLPTEVKAQFVNESLASLFGEQYQALAPDKQQRMVEFTMNEARPKGFVESAIGIVPVVAPIIRQYAYGREVQASPLVEKIVGPEASREFGGLLQAGEDLVLIGASIGGLAAGAATMGLAPAGVFAARTLGTVLAREAALGTLYDAGKLVTTPPKSTEEAAVRLGVGAVTGALFGSLIEGGINIFKDRRMEGRWINAFGSKEAADAFTSKIQSNDLANLTLDEISLMERVAGDSTAEWAQTLRTQAQALRLGKETLRETQALKALELEGALGLYKEQFDKELSDLKMQRMLEVNRSMAETRIEQQATEEASQFLENEFWNKWRDNLRIIGEEAKIKSEALTSEMRDSALQASLREADLTSQERQAISSIRETATTQQRQLRVGAELQTERLERIGGQLREADLVAQERQAIRALQEADDFRAQQNQAEEIVRQASVNADLAALRSPVGKPLTRSEAMMSQLISDPQSGHNGFVGTEPVTLPIGMIHDTPQGGVPVIVDKFNASQGILRGGKGFVPRTALREPRNASEAELLNNALAKQGIGGTPSRSEAEGIVRNRVAAEQLLRRADAHSARPDFASNAAVQEQSFLLRKEAAERLLQATNKEFSSEVASQLQSLPPLAGTRSVGSIDNFPIRDLNDTAHALRGAGFENVRMGMSPSGKATVVFTHGDDPAKAGAAALAIKNATHRGIFDATQGTYSGLTFDEHTALGSAYGITDKNKKFETFMRSTLEEMNSRGIRVPATHETLGVRPIEEQIVGRSKRADAIRPEAVAEAEAQQLFNVGDFVRLPVKDAKTQLWEVTSIAGSEAQDVRNILLQSLDPDVAKFGPLQFTPEALRAAGAVRETKRTLGKDPVNYSLATSLEAMLHPEARSAAPVPIENSISAIERSARALGFSVSTKRATGDITFRQGPMEFNFKGLTSIDDAASFINNLRIAQDGKRKLIDSFGGIDCLGGPVT